MTLLMRCDCCEADTPHALTRDRSEYVCGFCGNAIIYYENTAKPMLAIDLRESPEARERFEDWIADL